MKPILSLAFKDLRLLSRDPMGLFFIIGFPIIMGVFFGLVGGSFGGGGATAGKMKVGLVDLDKSSMSQRFASGLNDSGSVELVPMDGEPAREAVRKGGLSAFIELPSGFGDTAGIFWAEAPAIRLGADPSRGAESGMLSGLIMQAMGGLIQQRFADPAAMRKQVRDSLAAVDQDALPTGQQPVLNAFMGTLDAFLGSFEQFSSQMQSSGGGGPKMEIARIERVDVTRPVGKLAALSRKLRSPWDISFPAAIMWGVMGTVAGFAVSVVRERTEGTFFRLSVAPITRTHVLAGKAAACFLTVCGVIAFMMGLGKVLGIQLARPDLLVLAALCIATCFVGMMMLMSVIGRTEEAVAGAGWAIIVTFSMFGGGTIPLLFLPGFMQTLSHFSPVKWGILALEGAVWRDFTFVEMLTPCAVLLAIGGVSFAVGARVFARQAD